MHFGCQAMDLNGHGGVLTEEFFRREQVVVRFGLLKNCLSILTNHDERREKYRLE